MSKYFGVRDGDGVSPFYKAYLTQEGKTVTGYLTSCSIDLNQAWTGPFAEDTAGNTAQKAAGVLQSMSGLTATALWNSELIWQGAENIPFQLVLDFVAYANAEIEVDLAIKALLEFASPQLNDVSPLGAIPQSVMMNLGRKIIAPIQIQSVSYDEAVAKTKEGFFVSNTVELTCVLKNVLNSSEIGNVFK